ncbi:MAG: GNAT family N-acetyltransferase [Acidimicrobiales bacterium]|jgi:predicted GNAT family acetyltransferase
MAAADDSVRVVLNADRLRYELWSGEELAGFASFRERPGKIEIFHAEVEPHFEGRGLGAQLAAGALDDARSQGMKVIPACPFVDHYVRDHPEYADLVAD